MKKIIGVLLTAAALSSTAAYAAPKAKPVHTKAAHTQEARNKANAFAFYDLAFNQHKPQEAVSKYVGKTYIQHNPTVADGGQAFIDAFAPFLKERKSRLARRSETHRSGRRFGVHARLQPNLCTRPRRSGRRYFPLRPQRQNRRTLGRDSIRIGKNSKRTFCVLTR